MLRPSSPGRRRPPLTDSAGSPGRIVPREARDNSGADARADERHSSDRMSSDPTAPLRSTTFGSDGGACHHACAALAGGRTPHEAPRTRPRRLPAARRRGAEPPGHRGVGGGPARPPPRPGRRGRVRGPGRAAGRRGHHPRHRRTGVLTGETPGEALDRLDLAKLRQLVDRVEARDAGGAVLVRLTSDLEQDAWLPGLDGALARDGLAAAPRVGRGRGRAQRAAHAERRARDRARHAEPARARARRAQPRARRHQPRRHRAAGRARSAGAGAARARGGQRELPGRADPRAAHAPVRGARHDRGDPARGRRPPAPAPARGRPPHRRRDGGGARPRQRPPRPGPPGRGARRRARHRGPRRRAVQRAARHRRPPPPLARGHRRLRGPQRRAHPAHRRLQALADPAQLRGQRPEVHRARRGPRVGRRPSTPAQQVRFAVADTGPGLEVVRPVARVRGVRPARTARRGRRAARLGPRPVDLQAPGDAAGRRGRRHQRAGPRHDLHGDHPGGLRAGQRGRGGRRRGVTSAPRGRPKLAYNRRPGSRPPRSGSR